MLDKLEYVDYNVNRDFNLLTAFAFTNCYLTNWNNIITEYVKLRQQLLQQLNEQIHPHLTEDEWTMLIIQVNSCPEIVNYLQPPSESFVPF